MMRTDKELLDWIMKKIENTRMKAMHAYKRGDNVAFEDINTELSYWSKLAIMMEERVKQNGDVDA